MRSRKSTSPASPSPSPSTTTSCGKAGTWCGSCARPSIWPGPAGPARCWWTCRRTFSPPPASFTTRNGSRGWATGPWYARHPTRFSAPRNHQGCKRPVVLAGHGIHVATAWDELRWFAERISAPVVSTLLGLSALSADHPLCLGMAGMHGVAWANLAVQNADLLIASGCAWTTASPGACAILPPRPNCCT